MTITFSNCASDCIAAVARGDREIDPAYTSARMNAKQIKRDVPPPEDGPESGPVYTVTTIAGGQAYGGTRTVAVCTTFARANQMVVENWGDLYECSYDFAVVEEVMCDQLYGGNERTQYWYAWTGDARNGSYVPIEKPAEYAEAGGFAIG